MIGRKIREKSIFFGHFPDLDDLQVYGFSALDDPQVYIFQKSKLVVFCQIPFAKLVHPKVGDFLAQNCP